jgi:hypothetical protein
VVQLKKMIGCQDNIQCTGPLNVGEPPLGWDIPPTKITMWIKIRHSETLQIYKRQDFIKNISWFGTPNNFHNHSKWIFWNGLKNIKQRLFITWKVTRYENRGSLSHWLSFNFLKYFSVLFQQIYSCVCKN